MFATVLALALTCGAVLQNGDDSKRVSDPRQRDLPKREGTEFRPVVGKPFMSLPVPPGITAGDIALFTKLLALTDEQTATLNELHDEYIAKNSDLRRDVEQQLYQRSSELASARGHEPTLELEVQKLALLADADALASKIEAIDAWLMGEAGAALDGVSEAQINRMRQLRQRDVWKAYIIDIESAAIDLCRLQLELDVDLAADAIDADALLAAQIEYEQTRTKLMEQHRRACIQSRPLEVEFIRCMAEAKALHEAGEAFDNEAMHERSQELRLKSRRPRIDAWRRMSDLNDRHVAALIALAPGTACDRLATAYRERAYPGIYPDEAHLQPVFDAIGALDDLDEGVRSAVGEIRTDYLAQEEALNNRLVAYYNEWFEPFWRTMTMNVFEFNEQGDGYFRLWTQRIELAEETWLRVREVLGPAPLEAIDDAVQQWKEGVRNARDEGPQHVSPYMTEAQRKRRETQIEEMRRLRESGALSGTRPTPQ